MRKRKKEKKEKEKQTRKLGGFLEGVFQLLSPFF